jgi:hypothetical protein
MQAVRNIEKTGRSLSNDEKEQLRKITFHWCGWSATDMGHEDDTWMQFLRHIYPDLDGLQPVLDSLIWPNEIIRYPMGYPPRPPWLFLLATKIEYYIYNYQDAAMFKAGSILTEVIDGLRKKRWVESPVWEEVPWATEEESWDYFPVYSDKREISGSYPLEREIKEFPLRGSHPLSKELIIESEDNI